MVPPLSIYDFPRRVWKKLPNKKKNVKRVVRPFGVVVVDEEEVVDGLINNGVVEEEDVDVDVEGEGGEEEEGEGDRHSRNMINPVHRKKEAPPTRSSPSTKRANTHTHAHTHTENYVVLQVLCESLLLKYGWNKAQLKYGKCLVQTERSNTSTAD